MMEKYNLGTTAYSAVIRTRINGTSLVIHGAGEIRNGLTRGKYHLERQALFCPNYLQALIITGYPNATADTGGAINPFKRKSYEYTRQLTFETGDVCDLRARCEQLGN